MGDPDKMEGGTALKCHVQVAEAINDEVVLPGCVQEALGRLVGAAMVGPLVLQLSNPARVRRRGETIALASDSRVSPAASHLRYRPNAAAQVRRTAPPARRSHSSRAIVPTGPEPAIPTATKHSSGSAGIAATADDRLRPQATARWRACSRREAVATR
jgi:hypothetical protein